METKSKRRMYVRRAAVTLLAMLLTTAAAWAQTKYISEVMLIGKNNKTEAYALRDQYVAQGWTAIDQDLNKGCGSKSDYIFLLYKTRTTASPNHTFITNFCISDATGDAPENLTSGGHRYTLVPYDGDDHFKEKRGDLNSNAGGKDIHLYYTTERMEAKTAVTSITFNKTKSGAVQQYDLNKGAGGDDIYMHCESSRAPEWVIDRSTDGGRCYVKGFVETNGVKMREILAFPAIIDGAVVVGINGVSFSDFDNLEAIYLNQDINLNTIPEAMLLKKLKHVHVVDNSGAVVKADELPASITSIPDYGFSKTSIETLKMPNVTSIGQLAFEGCSALKSVKMPNVTSIGEDAFYNCTALTDITLPSTLKNIGKWAFMDCTNLTKVTINSNPTMGADAIPDGATLMLKVRTNTGDDASWLTFYNDRYNFKTQGQTKVYKATVADGKVCLTEVADKIVNAGTAVVLKTGASSSFVQLYRTTNESTDEHPNDLQGLNARTYIPNMLAGDYAVPLLEAADKKMDGYITAIRYSINAHAALPDGEATKQEAKQCAQVFKDFDFHTNDAYGAESDKIIQMQQNLQAHQSFLQQIGAWTFFTKAVEQAQLVRQYLGQRAQTKGEFVKGEMKAARKATDQAIADLYKTITAMMDLLPSTELTALYNQLKGIEIYARQYYLNEGSTGSGSGTGTSPNPSQGGENGGNTGGGGGNDDEEGDAN